MAIKEFDKEKPPRLDDNAVGLAILAYLVKGKEDKRPKVTANEICNKAPEFQHNMQRNQRIQEQLEVLLIKCFVQKEELNNATYWEVTDIGYKFYKDFGGGLRLFFARPNK